VCVRVCLCESLGIADGQSGVVSGPSDEELESLRIEESKAKEEERIRLAVEKLKKPLIPRPWDDLGSQQEILDSKIKPSRPLVCRV